jgi:SNF2 family DNA or RNA helicase
MKRWTPHPYQIEGVKFLLQNSHAGLLWSPGCGKTAVVLAALSVLKAKGMLKRALIIAPRRPAKLVWPKERLKWADFMGLTIDVLHGTPKYREDLLNTTTADICVITPEGLDWLVAEGRLAKLGADVLVVDESSYFRTHSSKRFKNIKPILHTFKRRVILTATPAPKSYENLWSQAYILDRGGALGPYITHYRMLYFNNITSGSAYATWELRPGADKLINEKLRPLMLREDAIDHLDMPQLIPNVIRVELDSGARDLYDRMERDFVVLLDGRDIMAPNAAVMGGKLRQISNGFLYNPDSTYATIHDEKIDALKALVDDLQGQPVLVLYEFIADRNRLRAAFPQAEDLGEGCTDKEADRICDEFNNGRLSVLLAHPRSAGHGLNLQGQAQHIVWFGPTWDLELDEQATARVWRQGNPHDRVFVHTIVVADSIEEKVAQALASKERSQKLLLQAMKRGPQPVVDAELVQH